MRKFKTDTAKYADVLGRHLARVDEHEDEEGWPRIILVFSNGRSLEAGVVGYAGSLEARVLPTEKE